jgi:hypothetical protein
MKYAVIENIFSRREYFLCQLKKHINININNCAAIKNSLNPVDIKMSNGKKTEQIIFIELPVE